MIDNIKVYFPANQFNGNFSNCILREKKDTRNEWRLNNPRNNSHISIWEHNNGAVTMKGSLRKWQFGNYSLSDLTLASFREATKSLAERLGLSWVALCSASATQIEFGFNIPTSIPFSKLSKKIVSYATFKVKKIRGKGRTKRNYGTMYFGKHDCDFRLKIYDKCKEIEDKADFIDDIAFPNPNPNVLRIEFTADDKNVFKRKGLPEIAKIEDILRHWEKIRELWAKEVGRIMIQNIITDTDDLALDDILCAEALNWYSWDENIEWFEEYIEEHYKTKKSANTAKSKLYRRIKNLFDNHSNKGDYRKIDFYKDIIRYFAEIKANGDSINLPRMVALLHAHTHYVGVES